MNALFAVQAGAGREAAPALDAVNDELPLDVTATALDAERAAGAEDVTVRLVEADAAAAEEFLDGATPLLPEDAPATRELAGAPDVTAMPDVAAVEEGRLFEDVRGGREPPLNDDAPADSALDAVPPPSLPSLHTPSEHCWADGQSCRLLHCNLHAPSENAWSSGHVVLQEGMVHSAVATSNAATPDGR